MTALSVAHPPLSLWRRGQSSFGLIRAFSGVPIWFAVPRRAALARWLEKRFFGQLLKSVGIQLTISGPVSHQPGTLFIVNHISWADIPVLAHALDATFVAKAEAGNWPVMGRLMRRYGVVLVDRTSKGASGLQVDAITSRLAEGKSVIIFPEGTTSVGDGILPFRSSLLQAARAAHAVQPVVLRYLAQDGMALSPKRQREVAWVGEDTLAEGIKRVIREPVQARLRFLEPLCDPSLLADRKQLCVTLQSAIAEAYAALPSRSR